MPNESMNDTGKQLGELRYQTRCIWGGNNKGWRFNHKDEYRTMFLLFIKYPGRAKVMLIALGGKGEHSEWSWQTVSPLHSLPGFKVVGVMLRC